MAWVDEGTTSDGIVERGLVVEVDGRTVPGVTWSPVDGADRLVLLGHGGSTHKRVEYLVEVARGLAGAGIGSLAIDGPGHGDRSIEIDDDELATTDDEVARDRERFTLRWVRGGGTAGVVADWQGALDFVESEHGARPTGWWGLSMGTMMGLPVAATDPRIQVAVLGLMGVWGPNRNDLAHLAGQVTCPLRFLVQWDDEVVPRESCLDLYDKLGSSRKTLHANPGPHAEVPTFEVVSSIQYLARHLGR